MKGKFYFCITVIIIINQFINFRTITNPLQKSGKKKAFLLAAFTWIYALPWAVLPFLEIWGKFAPEGYLTTCTVDYLTDTSQTRMFIVTIFFAAYVLPLSLIIYFYTKIVLHVINHEKSLKAQVIIFFFQKFSLH